MVRCTTLRMSPVNFSHTLCESFRTGICSGTERILVLSHIDLGRSAAVRSIAFARAYADGARQGGIPGCVQIEGSPPK